MEWSRRRHRLNHDWLKNQFLTALAHMDSIAQDLVNDPAFVPHFFQVILPQWINKRQEVLDLARTFEQEMSPRTLLLSEPIVSIQKMQAEWIAQLIHLLWQARVSPKAIRFGLEEAITRCDAAYAVLKQNGETATKPIDIVSLGNFRASCFHLSTVLSECPSTIKFL